MTLKEAIKILTFYDDHSQYQQDLRFKAALKLLIEAGKRVLNSRVEPTYSSVDPLPGETKD